MSTRANYRILMTVEQLKVLAAALQELPYRLARPVLEDLQAQVAEQDEADKEEEAKKADEAKKAEAARVAAKKK